MLLLGLRGEDIVGQKEISEVFKDHQHFVGDDFRVRPHITDRTQQGQAIQRPQRMVGDHNQLALRGDFMAIDAGKIVGKVEFLKNLVDKSQTAGFAVPADLGVDLLHPQQPAETADDEMFNDRGIFPQ
jgi:hypothetical protein